MHTLWFLTLFPWGLQITRKLQNKGWSHQFENLRSPQGSVNRNGIYVSPMSSVFRNRNPVLSSYKTGFVTRVTRRAVLVEQELITLRSTRINTRFCCVLVVQLHVVRFLVPCCDGSYDIRVKRCSDRLWFIIWRACLICVICIDLRILVVHKETYRPAASHWQTLSNKAASVHLAMSGIRTQSLVVIGADFKILNPTIIRSRPPRPLITLYIPSLLKAYRLSEFFCCCLY